MTGAMDVIDPFSVFVTVASVLAGVVVGTGLAYLVPYGEPMSNEIADLVAKIKGLRGEEHGAGWMFVGRFTGSELDLILLALVAAAVKDAPPDADTPTRKPSKKPTPRHR